MRLKNRHRISNGFAFILFQFVWLYSFAIEPDKGLSFLSYEVSPDKRTSFSIPAEANNALRFKDFLSLSFELKIDSNRERFGYICRTIIDGQNVDLLLSNPAGVEPFLGIAVPNTMMEPLPMTDSSPLSNWTRIQLTFCVERDSLRIIANQQDFTVIPISGKDHGAVFLFGANNRGIFSTTDVAPFAIRNVEIQFHPDAKPKYAWELTYVDGGLVSDNGGTLDAAVRNPEWLIEKNTRWLKQAQVSSDSQLFGIMDASGGRILLVNADKVTEYRLQQADIREYPFSQNIKEDLITNNFIVLPDGRLVYYDFESSHPLVNTFDFETCSWDRSVNRTNESPYLHHNAFFNSADSSLVQLFGYGFHKYSNEMLRWPMASDSLIKTRLDIPPRYLSAVGVTDSLAYVYGGKGNEKGIQELGTVVYNDFYEIRLDDYSVRKLWNDPKADFLVAASDLIVDKEKHSFRALFHSPNVYQSVLQMQEYSLEDGLSKSLANPLPYPFLDVDSEAHLLYDPLSTAYFALLIYKEDQTYQAAIYRINSPIITLENPISNEGKPLWPWGVAVLLFCVASLFVAGAIRRRRCPDADAQEEQFSRNLQVEAPAKGRRGISLIGGFQVVNKEGKDITGSFTPIMRQLLALILLYTKKNKGISNAELKEMLWFDKSEESYTNNRGVNLRKIRLLLEDVGDVEIVSGNGYWSIKEEEPLCDYFSYTRKFENLVNQPITQDELLELISCAHSGTLLPDIQFDAFDRFKAEYADMVITLLGRISNQEANGLSPEMIIKLADAILLFDSLDEQALKSKCRALIELKHLGMAQNVFKVFARDYENLMGEAYKVSFNEFVKVERKRQS